MPLRALALVPLLFACAPGTIEQGNSADVTFTREGEAPVRLVHDPLESTVTLTPPVANSAELTFRYQDPQVELRLTLDGDELEEGERVTLPADEDVLALNVRWDSVRYTSGPGASGTVELQLLSLEPAAAVVSALVDAVLVTDDGEELGVEGFVEADG